MKTYILCILQLQPRILIGGEGNHMVPRRIVAMVTDPTEMGGKGEQEEGGSWVL